MSLDVPPSPQGLTARPHGFHELMRNRVQRILLVSSLYDSFIMSEEGRLHETLLSQFIALNLSDFPDLIRVPNAEEAMAKLRSDPSIDVVISTLDTGDANAADFARDVQGHGLATPVIALAYTNSDLRDFLARRDVSFLDRIFLWQGDVRILVAIVKYLEDRMNVAHDTGQYGVPAIIVVEDNIRFFSSFLPVIYAELFRHIHRLLSEDLNLSQKMVRMRARPKVLLANTYEEAWELFEKYQGEVLGVVSDFEFPQNGDLERYAGLDLCSRALAARPDLRIVLQSSIPENRKLAEDLGASFLLKGSPVLLQQLRTILIERFGFGDFIFRMPDQSEIDRASDLRSFGEKLESVPPECVAYHAERQHFSNWFKARTEFELAEKLRPRQLEDFESADHLREDLLQAIREARRDRHRTVIADFDRATFDPDVSMTRIGAGSLGGKARGVAFANRILRDAKLDDQYPTVDLDAPPCVVLGTEIFDEFLDHSRLGEYAMHEESDQKIMKRFLRARFPPRAVADLRAFLEKVRYPLAVRSSGLMEDSLSQPFAGVYETYMLPNNHPNLQARLKQLVAAIKRVYASPFAAQAKAFLSMTSYRVEEEKMAVMIQEMVGIRHQDRFYPDFAGVARSYNFYPEPGHDAEDGVVAVALGMGRTVVDGNPCLRFCPKHPRKLISFSSIQDALSNSQREFYGLDLARQPTISEPTELRNYPLEVAEEDGTLAWLGSTYLPDDEVIVDGISRDGVRLVSFAQVLKHGAYPLAELICDLLASCAQGTGGPVEIEFAGNLGRSDRRAEFAFLQLRPLALSMEEEQIRIDDIDESALVCRSDTVLGNGLIDDIHDIVMVDPSTFDRLRSREAALEIARFDAVLRREQRPYLLVGPGRWGSADPSLGIPVTWDQIAGVKVIVEARLRDLAVEPSQGTHFFQNLTSCNVGYLTVRGGDPKAETSDMDWEWLRSLPVVEEGQLVRHARVQKAIVVKVSARDRIGVVMRG